MIKKFQNICIMFILYAMCGWIYEEILVLKVHHTFFNRGFLFGPWLPVYGFGGLIIYIIFKKLIQNPIKFKNKYNINIIILFIGISLLATIVELLATYIVELTGTNFNSLWNYSNRFLNFQGRIALWPSLRFGFLGLTIIYIALPIYEKLKNISANKKSINIILWIIISLFFIDIILRIPFGNNFTGPVT